MQSKLDNKSTQDTIEKLRANIRNNYKNYINKTQKSDVELQIINSKSINIKLFEDYGKIHNQTKTNVALKT